jgi:hypothetical protein
MHALVGVPSALMILGSWVILRQGKNSRPEVILDKGVKLSIK